MPRLIREQEKSSIRPNFLKPKYRTPVNPSPKTELRHFEDSAATTPDSDNTPTFSEQTPSNIPTPQNHIRYTGNGANRQNYPSQAKNQNTKSVLKKSAPVSIIMTIILGFVVGFGFLTSQIGVHVHELLTTNTSSDFAITQLYTRANTVKSLKDSSKLSKKFQTRLEKQGIKVTPSGSGYELDFKGTKITADNFDSVIANNAEFRNAYTRANRGRVANFYDNAANALYKELGISRNVFKDYKQTDNAEADAKTYKDTLSQQFSEDADSRLNTADETTSTDEDGNEVTERTSSGEDVAAKTVDGDTKTAKATSYISNISNKVAKGADGATAACAILKAGNMISTAVAAYDMYNSIHNFMLQMESISKTKAGFGNESAINAQNNLWTTEVTTTVHNVTTGQDEEVTGAPISAEGLKLILSGETPNQTKLQNYSTDRSLLATFRAITDNGFTTNTCAGIQAVSAAISLSTLAVPGSGFVKTFVGSLIKQVVATTAIQGAVAGVLSTLVPIVADALFANPADLIGIPSGEQTAKGAGLHSYLTSVANSGLTPASKENTLQAYQATQVILAQEAESDRLSRSPLDPSSPNTFLGSIVSKLVPTFSSNSFFSSLTNFTSLTNSALTGRTFADGENTSYLTTISNCTASTDVSCYIYDIPVTAADPSAVNLSEDDPDYASWLLRNTITNSSGESEVLPGSFLAEYIELVMGRRSLIGVYDAGIADRALEYLTGGVSSISDSIPYVSDAVDLFASFNNAEVETWARGTVCEYSANNPRWESDCKYAQHYALEARTNDQLGYYEDSSNPVFAFQSSSDYLNPSDNSRVAVLARYSGLSQDDSETVLALFDYLDYLATYSPEDAYAFNNHQSSSTQINLSTTQSPIKHYLAERSISTSTIIAEIKNDKHYQHPREEGTIA